MNTILQKRIEGVAREYSFNIPSKIYQSCKTQEEMKQWKDEIEQAYIEGGNHILQNQWISVEEALPDYEKDVFVRFVSRFPNNPNEFEIGYCTRWRTKDETVKTDPKGFSIIGNMEITHWMEIPSLKGGEK